MASGTRILLIICIIIGMYGIYVGVSGVMEQITTSEKWKTLQKVIK